MKRFTLWFAVALACFSFSGGFAEEEMIPADLASMPSGVLKFDNYIPGPDSIGKSLKDFAGYWAAVRFEVPDTVFGFTLKGVEFKVDNELLNVKDSNSFLYLVIDTCPLCSPFDFAVDVIDSVKVGAPFNRLQYKEFPASHAFTNQARFWIVLGPVPGGLDTNLAGQGWWAFSDRSANQAGFKGSYVSFGGRNSWTKSPDTVGNFVIRARGNFSPQPDVVINEIMFNADTSSLDSTRNHEWVELYNRGPIQKTEGWKLVNESNTEQSLPNIDFFGGYYWVVHFGAPGHALGTYLEPNRFDTYLPPAGEFFSNRKGGCALNVGPTQHISFMGWNLKNLGLGGDSISAGGNLENLFISGVTAAGIRRVRRIQPTEGVGPLLEATAGISIGLDSLSNDSTADLNIDSEGPKSATFVGGPDAAGPTMGRRNLLPMTFDVTSQLPPPGGDNAKWTVMLYMAADYGSDQRSPDRWYYDILNQIEQAVWGGNDSVNVVVLYDTRRAHFLDSSGIKNATFEGALRNDSTDIVRNLKLLSYDANTGRDTTLAGFINRAKSSYPADHYVLALKGDGAGWEGLCGDADATDRLQMGELKSAFTQAGLDTAKLDLLIFDTPLMSQLEVATQVKNFAHAMVASPEMTGPADFNYPEFVKVLKSGASTATFIDSLQETNLEKILKNRTVENPFAVWTITDLDNLETLLGWVDTLAVHLKAGVGDVCGVGDASDNYQLSIRSALRGFTADHYGLQAQGMADFIDLGRFVTFLNTVGGCTSTHRKGANELFNLLRNKGPVIAGLVGGGTVGSGFHRSLSAAGVLYGGLSIYFPSARQRLAPLPGRRKIFYNNQGGYLVTSDHPFDTPGLATEGGVYDTLRLYAADTNCYPHSGDTCGLYSADLNYPHSRVMNFDFVDSTGWDDFLIRYYKPVADAGGDLSNVPLKSSFSLDARGSSDADDDVLSYHWDLFPEDDTAHKCTDFLFDDMDKNCQDDGNDDADMSSSNNLITFSEGYSTAGDKTIWLHVWDAYDSGKSLSARRYQTSSATFGVQIRFDGVQLAEENTAAAVVNAYTTPLTNILPQPDKISHLLDNVNIRKDSVVNVKPDLFIEQNSTGHFPHIIWIADAVKDTIFPRACQKALDSSLVSDRMGVWILSQLAGKDPVAKSHFNTRFGFHIDADTTRHDALYLEPEPTQKHFLTGLERLELKPGTKLERLDSLHCPVFPLLITDNGDTVMAGRVLPGTRHGILFSTFGLENLADTIDARKLLERVLSWLSLPETSDSCLTVCPAAIGDMNGDGNVTPADAVAMSNCAFLGTGGCDLCFADVNCDGGLTNADVVLETNVAFLGVKGPTWCGP